MSKKTKNVLLIIMLVALCLLIFASCSTEKPDIFEYSGEDMGVMGRLVQWMHGWIGNYGWTVVVFTVFLKILMLPLDFWQRYSSRKSSLKMQQMQPIIEGIDKRYGANTQRANEEKQKLYKKQGFSMLSTCLPMIVSMVIFFVMFAGLRDYSTYSNIQNFKTLSNEYYTAYSEELTQNESSGLYKAYYEGYTSKTGTEFPGYNATSGNASESELTESQKLRSIIAGLTAARQYDEAACVEAEDVALKAVQEKYLETRESWLWIQNVWQPDTWAKIMQPYEGNSFAGNGFSATVDMTSYFNDNGESTYNKIFNAVLQTGGYGNNGSWNGLMILPFLSIGLSFLSMFISQRMERKNRKGEVVQQNSQQKTTNTMMMIMMPLMMAWFGFIYTGAFAIYMVVNYTLSIITTVTMRYPVEKMVTKRLAREEEKNKSGKASYLR